MLYGALVGWLIYRLQRFEHRPVSGSVAAIVWGLFVAGGVVEAVGQDLQNVVLLLVLVAQWGL
ncbi:MAG: hypothetical protein QNJ89_10960 [Acidimicrobiia bacterium]|nr:hypothetical protein [Acidimicrobiia bacterium]